MIDGVIRVSLQRRLLVLLAAAAVVGGGLWSLRALPIDAFPDVTPTLVQVFTESEGLAPEEVERLITYPIEVSMNGLPAIESVKSLSTFGLSVVSVYFKDGVDIYFARQLVLERLQQAKEEIPHGLGEPVLGPVTTGLGQVYQYQVQGDGHDLMELRTIQDWIVKFHLRTVPGVTEVLSFGGHVRQYQVQLNPQLLLKYGITLNEVMQALTANNRNVGGGFIEQNAEEYLVRGIGWVKTVEDLGRIVVESRAGTPIYVRDVATVTFGPEIRRGAVTRNGQGEIVAGIVLKLIHENTSRVIDAVKAKVAQINRILPMGVKVVPYYDQSELVAKCLATVRDALLIGAGLIALVLLLFLGDTRSALIVTALLPLCALFTFILMKVVGLSANLMSLGGLAIGIGMLVDGGVVMVENVHRHVTAPSPSSGQHEPALHLVSRAAQEVGRPISFAIGIIIVVFLPLFTLQGVEGKLFSPLALTISFAMLGSLLFSLTVVPVLCSLFLTQRADAHHDTLLVQRLKQGYAPILQRAMRHPKRVVALAVGSLVGSLALVPFLGTEFVPVLDEGSLLIRATAAPSTSLNEMLRMSHTLERLLLEFPEVKDAVSKVGRAELGGDPDPVNAAEIDVELKPRRAWKTARTKAQLIKAMEAKLEEYPGIQLSFTQPIAERVDELLSGVKAQLAINLFGDDLAVLGEKANEISRVVQQVRGAADVQVEQVAGQPQLVITVDRDSMARYGINAADVQDVISTAVGGETVGQVFEGQKRFDIFVRLQEPFRHDLKAIGNLLVRAPSGAQIPLAQLASLQIVTGPKQISRENSQRRIVIQANVRGRDMGSFVADAQHRVERAVNLPPGYLMTWGGQFENQQRAMRRLMVIVPITVLLIFLLLYFSFNSLKSAALIILNVPFAMVGGILALGVTRLYLSVPASVGFIALFGVAVLNGVVLVSCIGQLRREGVRLEEAVRQGCERRLRPVLMTACVASLGLVPLLFSTGTGSEVQRPLATVVIGGLISSTALTLVVLPAIYRWFEKEEVEF